MTEWFRTWIAKVAKDFVTCFITKDRWKYIVKGLGNTLQIALAAVLLGILIGTIVAIIRSTHDKTHETMRPGPGRTLLNIANWLCKVYLTVIRGTPAMIQILIMFFVVFSTARNGTPVAMLTFGINSGAYVAEIIRGGIISVDKGQKEAAHAIGMTHWQSMIYVVLPQAVRNIMPSIGNEFVVNIKDSSVLNVISVNELFFMSKSAAGTYLRYFEVFFITACIYLVLTFTVTRLLRLLERKMDGKTNYIIYGSQSDSKASIKIEKEEGVPRD